MGKRETATTLLVSFLLFLVITSLFVIISFTVKPTEKVEKPTNVEEENDGGQVRN